MALRHVPRTRRDRIINARTDVLFQKDGALHEVAMNDAFARAAVYADAGADGIFVHGLADASLIAAFCEAQPLPVNVMRMGDALDIATLAERGVMRISHGPGPHIAAMKALTQTSRAMI